MKVKLIRKPLIVFSSSCFLLFILLLIYGTANAQVASHNLDDSSAKQTSVSANSQVINTFDKKWTFLGGGIVYFSIQNGSLNAEFVKSNSLRFEQLYLNNDNNPAPSLKMAVQFTDSISRYFFYSVHKEGSYLGDTLKWEVDTIFFSVNPKFLSDIQILQTHTTYLSLKGEVLKNSIRTEDITHNGPTQERSKDVDIINCPCVLHLYDAKMLGFIKGLKPIEDITKQDTRLFVQELRKVLKKKCNLCGEDYFVSDVNDILIKIGYNPIFYDRLSTMYRTSGLYIIRLYLDVKFEDLKKEYIETIKDFYKKNG